MDIDKFKDEFEHVFNEAERVAESCEGYQDPVPEIVGVNAAKPLWLLNLAYSFLTPAEAYLEVGVFHGKNLIAALRYNDPRAIYACDTVTTPDFVHNLRRARITERVVYFNSDFRDILNQRSIQHQIGLLFFNHAAGAEEAIPLVESIAAQQAIVVIGNWSSPAVSAPVIAATRAARYEWSLLYDLPSRHPEDTQMWWNGIGVFSIKKPMEAL